MPAPRKTAVLYARFSSHNQREVSINDQLRVCRDYCKREGIQVVGVYFDKAMTGTNDKRPDFQRMIANAPESDYVVVYMFERFSRGKYDAPLYKYELEKKGVKVLSALEYVPDAPEGVMMEKLYEGQAAYYSLKLSRDVRRGMNSNAEKCMTNGVRVFGYGADPDTDTYVVNEEEAAVVREVFSRYINGETLNSIARDLARRGWKTYKGNPVGYSFTHTMIHNRKYTGIYKWGDFEKVGGMPQIIDNATFNTAQKTTHKKVRANEEWTDYPLTGKLICAICGEPMHGFPGTSHTGQKYYYYGCKKGAKCYRKPIRKDLLEGEICREVTAIIDNPAIARHVAELVVNQYKEGDAQSAIKATKAKLRENEKAMQSIDRAIEQGIITPNTKSRIDALVREHDELEGELGRLRVEDMGMTVDDLTEFLLHGFSEADDELLLKGFVNQVFLFDGYAVGTLNFRNGANELEEIRFALEELKLPPEKNQPCTDGTGFGQNCSGRVDRI